MEAVPITLYDKQYWKVGDQIYTQIGDKLVRVDHFDENNKPVCKDTWSEETPNAKGGQDCTVHMECLQITAKPNKLG